MIPTTVRKQIKLYIVDSCDLVFSVIALLIKQRYALPEFIRLMSTCPGGIDALEAYCQRIGEDPLEEHSKMTILKNLYYQEDRRDDLAILLATQSLHGTDLSILTALLQEAIETWEGGTVGSHAVMSRHQQPYRRQVTGNGIRRNCVAALSGQLTLLQSLSVLEAELSQEFPRHGSLADTVQILMKQRQFLRALQLKNDHGLQDSM